MKTQFDELYERLGVFDDSNIVADDLLYDDEYAAKEGHTHILGLWRLAVELGERGKVMQARIEQLEGVIDDKIEEITRLKCDDREIDT